MGLLDRLFRRREAEDEADDDPVITLDVDTRRTQLLRLEQGLDALARQMRQAQSLDNPGWRGRVNEYNRLAGDAMTMRRGVPTREGLLDLVFEVRPVFTGTAPPELASLAPLQDEVMAAADDLRGLLPGEKS